MSDKKRIYGITSAVMLIRTDKTYGPRMTNCWLPAEIWVEALKRLGHIDAGLTFNVGQFNAAFARSHEFGSVMSRFDGSNNTGTFRVSYQHRHYYYLTQESKQATCPSPLNQAWKERVMEIAANVLVIPSTRARPCTGNLIPVLATTATDGDNVNANEDEEQPSPSKRHRAHAPASVGDGSSTTRTSYWPFSLEAFRLFRPSSRSGGDTLLVGGDSQSITETPQEALERRILVLQSVNKREDSWHNVIIGRDIDNFCTKTEIFDIRQQASF
ncbi:hypothetical protein MHU86_20763 [Fragilaria crotonensis]|nr:hypothetical protein MHU86_20763 [Fragilaria crotonensis]